MATQPSPELAPFHPDGKSAIVTGAGSGVNLAFAKLLLSKGCNVLFADLALRPEAKEVVDAHQKSPRAVFQKTDVTDWTQINQMFAKAVAEFGTLDIVCPGAGVFEENWSNFWHPPGTPGSVSRDPVEGFGHYGTLDINITHPIRATQLAIAEFLTPSNGGPKASHSNPKRVIHIASIAGESPVPLFPLYGTSKHAIIGFVRSLGFLDNVNGIRVSAVAPGVVKTPLWMDHPDKLKLLDTNDDWVTVEEVADAMLTLVEDPAMVGGTVLEVLCNKTREVPIFGNEGPSGPGSRVSAIGGAVKDMIERLGSKNWGKPSQ